MHHAHRVAGEAVQFPPSFRSHTLTPPSNAPVTACRPPG